MLIRHLLRSPQRQPARMEAALHTNIQIYLHLYPSRVYLCSPCIYERPSPSISVFDLTIAINTLPYLPIRLVNTIIVVTANMGTCDLIFAGFSGALLCGEEEWEAEEAGRGRNLELAIRSRFGKRIEKMLLVNIFEDRSKVLQRHPKLRSIEKTCLGLLGLKMSKL